MTTEFIEKNVGILPFLWYSIKAHECLAQLGEHFLDVEGVMGSSPTIGSNTMIGVNVHE